MSYRDIGDSEDKMFMHFDIAMFETPMGDKVAVLWNSGHVG